MTSPMPLWTIRSVEFGSWKWLRAWSLCVVLSLCLIVQGCTASQFEAVISEIGPAVATILQLVELFHPLGADATSLPTKISADAQALETLYNDWTTAVGASKDSIQADINAGFTVLENDLNSVFQIANVTDQQTQLKIAALIGLVQAAVSIVEALVPNLAVTAGRYGAKNPPALDANTLVVSWNKILTAKTGNLRVDDYTSKHQLHIHGRFLRIITIGIDK